MPRRPGVEGNRRDNGDLISRKSGLACPTVQKSLSIRSRPVAEFFRARAEGTPFQLAILDLTVRGGSGGIDTLARLRQLDRNLLAIAISGYADEASYPGLRSAGFVRVPAKPFMLHELCSTIKAVLP